MVISVWVGDCEQAFLETFSKPPYSPNLGLSGFNHFLHLQAFFIDQKFQDDAHAKKICYHQRRQHFSIRGYKISCIAVINFRVGMSITVKLSPEHVLQHIIKYFFCITFIFYWPTELHYHLLYRYHTFYKPVFRKKYWFTLKCEREN